MLHMNKAWNEVSYLEEENCLQGNKYRGSRRYLDSQPRRGHQGGHAVSDSKA